MPRASPGKAFTGFLMEIIGRRWTIVYALAGSLPGLVLMLMAHRAGDYATVVMVAGGLITGFTVLSAFTATRVYLSEQFPTALRGRGHIFGESFGRLFAGGLAPFLMEPHTGSATIFFGTIFVVVAIGAFIPLAVRPRDRRPARDHRRRGCRAGVMRNEGAPSACSNPPWSEFAVILRAPPSAVIADDGEPMVKASPRMPATKAK